MQRTIPEVPRGAVFREKSTGTWRAELVWKDRGVRKQWKARTKREAEARMEAYRDDLLQGLDPQERTWASLVEEYLAHQERRLRPSTVAYERWCLAYASFLDQLDVSAIRATHVERVMAEAEEAGLSPTSVRAIRKQVRAVLQRAVRDRLIGANPADVVAGPRTERKRLELPPVADVVALLDTMRTEGHPSWPLLWTIAGTGMRTGEARSLRWADVSLDQGVVRVAGQLARDGTWSPPKTDAGVRDLTIGSRLRLALEEAARRREERPVASPYVFAGKDGQVPGPWTTYKAWTRAQERAWGEARISVHGLRHLALSALIVQPGVSLADVAAQAGHSSPRITAEVYSHTLADHQKRVRKALGRTGLG